MKIGGFRGIFVQPSIAIEYLNFIYKQCTINRKMIGMTIKEKDHKCTLQSKIK